MGYCNSNSYAGERVAETLPWVFRAGVAGFEGGWPA
jgi:hypothetical protein